MERVVFRKFKEGDVIALFPDQVNIYYGLGTIGCYQHIGQHGKCSLDITSITKLATIEEYEPLLKELKSIGYENLRVMKKLNIDWSKGK